MPATDPAPAPVPPAPAPAAAPAAAASAPAWSLARRLAFRFVAAYFFLYNFPFPLNAIPGLEFLENYYARIWYALVPWLETHILGFGRAVPVVPGGNGSGDTIFHYVQNLCLLTLAVAAAAVWTLMDRRRWDYRRLHDWLRVYVRYVLGFTLLAYGTSKVIKLQFPYPSLDRLLQPFGDSSPMGLLWRFMGYSKPYTFFAGAMEVLGGMLVFFRRTTTLGALVVIAVMSNVVLLNFSYDVPVKLYSVNLLLMAVFLAVPDLRRLADVLVLHRPTVPADIGSPFTARWMRTGAAVVKTLFIGGALVYFTISSLNAEKIYGEKTPRSPLYGIYEVDELVRNGQLLPPLTTDGGRWRYVTFDLSDRFAIRMMNNKTERYRAKYDTAQRRIVLASFAKKPAEYVLSYARPDKDHLLLQGRLLQDSFAARLHRIDETSFVLVSRGYHWINEFPLNR